VVWARALFRGRAIRGPYLENLLFSAPVSSDDPGSQYAAGMAIHEDGLVGPTFGHRGWIPGYISSLQYYRSHGFAVAFQINTDIGILDHSTSVVEDMETRLARVIMTALPK